MTTAISPEPRVEVMDITPKLASEWLNGHNRALRETVWRRYARDMASGAWLFNGDSIKRCVRDETDDGQHRLKAIIESEVTIKSVVVSNLPHEAQDTVDRGLPRNIPDALRLHGEKDVNNLAAAISQVIVLRSSAPTQHDFWPSTPEALAFLSDNPGIRESVLLGNRVRAAVRTPTSTAGSMHFIFSEIDAEDAEGFFDSLITGVRLSGDSPVLRLREFMFRDAEAQRRVIRPRLSAYYIKAWNAYRAGTPMKLLAWRPGGANPEKFPVPA